jgi:hypothetical protein
MYVYGSPVQNVYTSIQSFLLSEPAVSSYIFLSSGANAILKVIKWLIYALAYGLNDFKYYTLIITDTFKCLTFVNILPNRELLLDMFISPNMSSKIIKAGINGNFDYLRSTYSSYSVSYIIPKLASRLSLKN